MLLVVGRSQRCCEKIHSAKDSKESSGPKMSVVPRLRNPSSNYIRVKVDSVSPELKITQLCPRTTDSSLPPLTDSSCLLGPRWHRDLPLPSCLSSFFLPSPPSLTGLFISFLQFAMCVCSVTSVMSNSL